MEKDNKKLKIALLGTRGVPAAYGGFETFVEELGVRLVERGHQVVVYGRRRFFQHDKGDLYYRGIERRILPTIMHKYLETPLHALFCFLDLFRRKVDVVLLCNAANSPFAWLVNLRRCPLLINVDGIERLRSKWNLLGKLWYRIGERCSVLFATRVVGDAKVIAEYYKHSYDCEAAVIAYGASVHRREASKVHRKYNLVKGNYLLYVSRLEPENNAQGVIEAYRKVKTGMPLVIVGDAPYAKEYIERIKRMADDRVIFVGYQFGEAYQELQSNCYLYIQATEVGGTHPALVEAMAYGNCVIANETPENIEVLDEAGTYYKKNDFDELQLKLQELIDDPSQVAKYQELAKARAEAEYNWDDVCTAYEGLFYGVVT